MSAYPSVFRIVCVVHPSIEKNFAKKVIANPCEELFLFRSNSERSATWSL